MKATSTQNCFLIRQQKDIVTISHVKTKKSKIDLSDFFPSVVHHKRWSHIQILTFYVDILFYVLYYLEKVDFDLWI